MLGVSVLNALFSFFQEFRAERAMEEIAKFLPRMVTVVREGAETSARRASPSSNPARPGGRTRLTRTETDQQSPAAAVADTATAR